MSGKVFLPEKFIFVYLRQFKNIVIASVLIVMGVVTARYSVYMLYLLHKKELHRQTAIAENRLPLRRLSVLQTNLYHNVNGVEWKDNNREVYLDGRYFEVLSIQKHDEMALVYLLEDTKETNLFNWFFFELDDEDEKNNEPLTDHIDFYFTALKISTTLKKKVTYIPYSLSNQPHLAIGHGSILFVPPKNTI